MSLSGITSGASLLQMQKAMFSKADVNEDGQLSQDEFASIGQNMPGGGKNGSARQLGGGSSASSGFSAETLSSLLSVQQSGSDFASRAAEMFSNTDSDADGKVTAEELATDMAAHAPPGAEGADTAKMAADLIAAGDTDGDGQLSSDEFTALKPPQGGPGGPGGPGGSPPGPPPTEEASSSSSSASASASSDEDKTYDAADTNKDGTVSMSELLASLQSSSSLASGFSSDVSDLMSKLLASLSSATGSTSTVSASA